MRCPITTLASCWLILPPPCSRRHAACGGIRLLLNAFSLVRAAGWASISFIKAFDESLREKYDLVIVSPRNYFCYTPLLPAMCAGTVEERSIVESVRAVLGNKGKFFEAQCTDILPEEKSIVACFPGGLGPAVKRKIRGGMCHWELQDVFTYKVQPAHL